MAIMTPFHFAPSQHYDFASFTPSNILISSALGEGALSLNLFEYVTVHLILTHSID